MERQGGRERRLERRGLASLSRAVGTLRGKLSSVITIVWAEDWLKVVISLRVKDSSLCRSTILFGLMFGFAIGDELRMEIQFFFQVIF